jgi:hypothetical protein
VVRVAKLRGSVFSADRPCAFSQARLWALELGNNTTGSPASKIAPGSKLALHRGHHQKKYHPTTNLEDLKPWREAIGRELLAIMFSPALQESGPAKGTRSSRRRQRPSSSDSLVQQPKAKRQRVPLTESTFVNPDAPPEMYQVRPEKLELLSIKRDGIENASAPRKELSVRSKRQKAGERVSKGDGSIVLVGLSSPSLRLADTETDDENI